MRILLINLYSTDEYLSYIRIEWPSPKSPLIFYKSEDTGEKQLNITGPSHLVEQKQNEIEKKIPEIKWKERDLSKSQPPESIIEVASDIDRKALRRLAAKIAYERWAQLRNAFVLDDKIYDEIRSFITSGIERNILCGILTDFNLLNGMLNFSTGHHGVAIIGHPIFFTIMTFQL